MTPETALKVFLAQPRLARLPKALVVACSGGADSVALLRAAAVEAPKLGWKVEALHCDHGLRRRAKGDAAFVAALCRRLGLRLHAFAAKLRRGPGMEARAREWRRRCYAKAGAPLVLLAHHARDQAETLLLNLVRGAGPKGAAGMRALTPLGGTLIGRPFLGLEPGALRGWLKRKRQPWREDLSNRDQGLARNRLRHRVLPELERLNPRAVAHLAAFAGDLAGAKQGRDLAGLLGLDRAARARAQAVLARGQGQADLGRGWTLSAGQGQVLVRQGPPAPAWEGWRFELKLGVPTARKLRQDKAFWFAPSILGRGLALRGLKPGERMRPFGNARGSRLCHDLLAEAGVPPWQRRGWPALVDGQGAILALPAVRRGQGWEAVPGRKALCLQWSRVLT